MSIVQMKISKIKSTNRIVHGSICTSCTRVLWPCVWKIFLPKSLSVVFALQVFISLGKVRKIYFLASWYVKIQNMILLYLDRLWRDWDLNGIFYGIAIKYSFFHLSWLIFPDACFLSYKHTSIDNIIMICLN